VLTQRGDITGKPSESTARGVDEGNPAWYLGETTERISAGTEYFDLNKTRKGDLRVQTEEESQMLVHRN